ncbi:MAG: site-specific integrase [Pleurocapsa sp. SU_196_0]|nr:site-specific integrase [Pleurocapsa sp. SU_196_0]
MTLEIQPYTATLTDRTKTWTNLAPAERKRRAAKAARDRDAQELWDLTEAWLCTYGKAGARVSPKTLETYEVGVRQALQAAESISLLDPPRDWGASYVRTLEDPGRQPKPMSPSSVRVKLAAARALWAALRWSEACERDPFDGVHAAKDPTPAWEKRKPYQERQLEQLLEIAEPRERVLLLLGAHGGLRIAESCALLPEDITLEARMLRVRHGKGGKARTVHLSKRTCDALGELVLERGQPIIGIEPHGARYALRQLCLKAGVPYQATHPLRHASGTRLYAQTKDLETVARHLGHANLETSRVYAKWSDEALKRAVEDW